MNLRRLAALTFRTPRACRPFVCVSALILVAPIAPAGAADTQASAPTVQSTRPADVPPTVTLPDELARVLTDYEAAWQRRDAAALAALFAEDGFVLSAGRPPVRGRRQIRERYEGSGGPLALRALAYATEGAVGYIIGGFAHGPNEPDTGKFTLTLTKSANGRWLIMSDMDNGNSRQ